MKGRKSNFITNFFWKFIESRGSVGYLNLLSYCQYLIDNRSRSKWWTATARYSSYNVVKVLMNSYFDHNLLLLYCKINFSKGLTLYFIVQRFFYDSSYLKCALWHAFTFQKWRIKNKSERFWRKLFVRKFDVAQKNIPNYYPEQNI